MRDRGILKPSRSYAEHIRPYGVLESHISIDIDELPITLEMIYGIRWWERKEDEDKYMWGE